MRNKSLPGLNVQVPWARLLLEGKKTIETRTYPLPAKYRGEDLWLIETPGRLGKFKARVIGVIRFSGCKHYRSAAEFYEQSDCHLVYPHTQSFCWREGETKFGWTVAKVSPVDEFKAPVPRGIVYARPFHRDRG